MLSDVIEYFKSWYTVFLNPNKFIKEHAKYASKYNAFLNVFVGSAIAGLLSFATAKFNLDAIAELQTLSRSYSDFILTLIFSQIFSGFFMIFIVMPVIFMTLWFLLTSIIHVYSRIINSDNDFSMSAYYTSLFYRPLPIIVIVFGLLTDSILIPSLESYSDYILVFLEILLAYRIMIPALKNSITKNKAFLVLFLSLATFAFIVKMLPKIIF